MRDALEKVRFTVHVHENCIDQISIQEQPGISMDVEWMKDTLEMVGVTLHVHGNYTDQVSVQQQPGSSVEPRCTED